MKKILNANNKVKEYYKILNSDFPEWLNEYVQCDELQKQKYISMTCGTIYTNLFNSKYYYSSLDHSVAVALIVWHFIHDKKQTLAGLFHDISTPAFKHCIDFLNGDYMKQESTEELTTTIIENSSKIMELLKRDNIKIDEVCNYHIYPIADNDTPRLSADRLEYSMSNACITYELADLDTIKKWYDDIYVSTNENGIPELAFKTEGIASSFVKITSQLSIIYREDKTRYSMQFLADIIRKLNQMNLISKEDLYKLSENEIINIIKKSEYGDLFLKWCEAEEVNSVKQEPRNVYYVNHSAKIRYINPLVNNKRIYDINKDARENIENNLKYDMSNYVYLDFGELNTKSLVLE